MSWDILPKANLQYFLQKIKAIIPTKTSDLANDSGYTDNIGTITGITMNGSSKGTSGVVDLGTVVTDVSGKADKSSTVSNVAYDTTNKKITKTINGTTTDVVTASTLKTDMELNNVGNFKAVSTSSNQGLTDTEKSNARANIDAPSNGDIQSSKTLKSSVVTVTDAAPINVEDITVDITPVQDLHGYDKPWAGGAGKNKLPMTLENLKARNTGGTWSGNVYTRYNTTVTVNVDNGGNIKSLTINGTPNENFNFIYAINAPLLVEGLSYILSGCPTGGSVSTYYQEYSNYTDMGYSDLGNGVTFPEFAHTYQYRVVQVTIKSGYNAQNLIFYPMIRLATETDATFAPYSNICPIEGWTGAELDRVGKNWLPNNYSSSSAAGISYTVNNDGTVIASNTATNISSFGFGGIKRIKAGSYILNGCPIGGSSSTFELQIVINGTTYRDYGSGVAFSTDHDADYSIQILIRNGYACPIGGLLFKAMIRLASITDPTYEPYQHAQATITFGETVYGCTVDFNTGKAVVNKGIVDLGTLDWSYDSSILRFDSYVSGMKQYGVARTNPFICSIYQTISDGRTWSAVPDGSIYNGINENIHVKDLRYTDATAFKTAVTGQTVCYELATPYTLNLTPAQLKMLKGTNTLTSNGATITLKYQPDNVIGELKGEIQKANSFVERMALREGSGAKDFSYGGWSFRLYIYRSMGQISMSLERISASSVTEQAVVKVFNDESDYRAPEELRPRLNLMQAATYTTPSGWSIQVYLKDDGYIMFTGIAPQVGASAPTSSNWNLVEPWATHQQAKDLFNN